MHPKSLIFRIALLVVAIEIAAFGALGWFYVDRLSTTLDQNVRSRIRLVGQMFAAEDLPISAIGRVSLMSDLLGAPYLRGLAVGGSGRVVVATRSADLGKPLAAVPDLDPRLFSPEMPDQQFLAGPHTLTGIRHIHGLASEVPNFIVAITIDTRAIAARKREIALVGVAGSLLFILLGSAGIVLLAQRIVSRRVSDSLAVLKKVEGGELDQRIPVGRDDELGQLQGGINSMIAKLGGLIDEHRRNADELRSQKDLLTSVIEHAPMRVFWKDRELRYLGCNGQFARDAGRRSPAELVGLTDFDMGWRDQAGLYQADDRLVMGSDRPKLGFEEPQTTPDGDSIWLWTSKVPLHDKDGEVIGVLGLYADITERKRVEESLRKLTMAVEQTAESILITNLDGVIEYVNDACVRNSGYRRDEIIGETPGIFRSGKTPPEVYNALWRAMAAGKSWKGEFHNRRKDGSEYIELANITPIRQADGVITHYVGVKQDITERTRMIAELENHRNNLERLVRQRTDELEAAKRAAESANLAKSAFLANMSHEIRTPLNAIAGLTHLIRRGSLSPQQAGQLGQLENAGAHLLGIINDILDISKIEAGKLVLEQIAFPLESLVGNVLSMLREQAAEKRLSLTAELRTPALSLIGDQTRLQQCLLNYASNAIKFTASGSVRLRVDLVAEDEESVLLRFQVADTGCGIEAGALPRLFQSFEQADKSTTRKYGGTGLGLAITRRLAQLMGGDAGVQSRPGEGSTFWFTARLKKASLPATRPAPMAEARGAEEILKREFAGCRVLLAEDEPVNREIASELLRDAGLEVDAAEDGAEAVRMVAGKAYALVLMDMQMPNMDGLEATRHIRQSPQGRLLPVLAMTANAFADDKARCFEAGMNDFITKPVDPEALFATVLAWLSKSRSGTPA